VRQVTLLKFHNSFLLEESRGFGFVTMWDGSLIDAILSAAPHNLDGK
jgi:hypothetical protein